MNELCCLIRIFIGEQMNFFKKIFLICFFLIELLIGQEWQKIEPTFHPEGEYDVFYAGHFINSDTGWCSDHYGGRIWKTTNGGYDWYLQKDSIGDGRIREFFFYDENN